METHVKIYSITDEVFKLSEFLESLPANYMVITKSIEISVNNDQITISAEITPVKPRYGSRPKFDHGW